jgi:nitrite reductase/ring-hydroxylating ferredoxin subunit
VAVFNVDGNFFALRDVCPHQGAALSAGQVVHCVQARKPGCYEWDPSTPFLRCPWHGWEYDLRTGQSWSGPSRVRSFPVSVQSGDVLAGAMIDGSDRVPGPYVAETIVVSVENDYVVLDDHREGAA